MVLPGTRREMSQGIAGHGLVSHQAGGWCDHRTLWAEEASG